MPIAVGDTVDAARLDLAVKTLARTDLFSDVNVTLDPATGLLTVHVTENPIINRVVFEGNSAESDDKLRDEISIHPRSIFTKSHVQQDVQKIVELYRRSGRISATVSPKIVELPQKRVDLVFEIKEGPKTGIIRPRKATGTSSSRRTTTTTRTGSSTIANSCVSTIPTAAITTSASPPRLPSCRATSATSRSPTPWTKGPSTSSASCGSPPT
jgi:outer membrane protein assembly factor BamA